MKKRFQRFICGALALALLITMTGCGKGPEGETSETQSRELSTESSSHENVPTPPKRTPTERPKKEPTKTVYDDSLIGEACQASGQETTSWDQDYSYEVRVPELLSDAEEAKALNAELMEIYGADAMQPPDPDVIKSSIGWESHWDGSLLSLEMIVDLPDGSQRHEIYYYDFALKTRLTSDDVLARMGLDWETLEPLLIRASVQANDHRMQRQDADYNNNSIADALALRAESALAAQDGRLPLYPDGDGTLSVYLNLAAGTGSGWEQVMCQIHPGEKFKTLSADYEFITAAVDGDGNVTVEYHKGGEAFLGADYQRIYGFEFDRAYSVAGCFGRYRSLFLGSLGSVFEPYLFLLTEDGTLEYVDLFRCARYGTYICGGPLYGVTGVTELSEGLVEREDYSYATVYAQDTSGRKHDLLETVYLFDGLPADLAKTFWVSGNEDSWLSLDAIDGIQARVSDGSTDTHYTGFPLRLGMSGDGMVYALDFWDESGQEMLCICALTPGNGALVMRQLSGVNPFGIKTGGTLYLFESYG